MTRYVALLRGIAPMNPKHKNSELRRVFEELGFDNVISVISSGNLIFDSPERSKAKLEAEIESALLDHLGAPCSTIVRSEKDIRTLAASHTFDGYPDDRNGRCNVTFLKHKTAGPELPMQLEGGTEILAMEHQCVLSVVNMGDGTPNVMTWLEKTYGKQVTTRTWKTVHRLVKAFDKSA